jgi:hypothetical protein
MNAETPRTEGEEGFLYLFLLGVSAFIPSVLKCEEP